MIKVSDEGIVWMNVSKNIPTLALDVFSLDYKCNESIISSPSELSKAISEGNVWIRCGKLNKEILYQFFKSTKKEA